MKAGTIVKLPDGRIGTVVYHNLDGYGIKWGAIPVPEENSLDCDEWAPDAMLRNADVQHLFEIECVGDEYERVELMPAEVE